MTQSEKYCLEARGLARACTTEQQAIHDGSMFGGRMAKEVIAWEAETGQAHGLHRESLEQAFAQERERSSPRSLARVFLDAALGVLLVELRGKA